MSSALPNLMKFNMSGKENKKNVT